MHDTRETVDTDDTDAASASESSPPEPPQLNDPRYEPIACIGEGAVAEVWKATDKESGRTVAIKLMQKAAFKLEAVQRLALEVSILTELDHPNIVHVFDTGVAADDAPYVVMEWVDGKTLRQHLLADERPPVEQSIDILEQICAALSAAHAAEIVHRDLKPENVLLRPDGAVKVVDFGMAKVLRSGAPALTSGIKIFGTPQYMAPERARGKPVEASADVYSLGLMAYEMLNGRRAFDGKHAMDVLLLQVNEQPPEMEPELDPRLKKAVLTALAKHPDDRPSATELARDLRAAIAG